MTVIVREQSWAVDTITALAALPPLEERALRLIYFDRVVRAEAAERIGMTLAAFSRTVGDAMRHLGQALRQTGPFD